MPNRTEEKPLPFESCRGAFGGERARDLLCFLSDAFSFIRCHFWRQNRTACGASCSVRRAKTKGELSVNAIWRRKGQSEDNRSFSQGEAAEATFRHICTFLRNIFAPGSAHFEHFHDDVTFFIHLCFSSPLPRRFWRQKS